MAPAAQKKPIPKTSPKRKTRAQTQANKDAESKNEELSVKKSNLKKPRSRKEDRSKTIENPEPDIPKNPQKYSENGDMEKTTKIVPKPRAHKKLAPKSLPPQNETSENVDDEAITQKATARKTRRRRKEETPKSPACITNKRQRKSLQNCTENIINIVMEKLEKGKQMLKITDEISNSIESGNNDKKNTENDVLIIDLKAVPNKTPRPCKNNNNNYINNEHEEEFDKNWKRQGELLEALCDALEEPPEAEAQAGYTHDDLKQFLLNSTLKEMFSFVLELNSTTEIFQRLNSVIYELERVQLDQLLDLYHLAIIMQNYQQLETHMGYRHELLDAVCELSVELQPKDIEYIGISLCDRFVIDTGMRRMEKVVNMHSSIVMLINNSDVNCRIAMITLLATFAKVSGIDLPEKETDIIKMAFEMAKLVDWMQLVELGCGPDLFVLVRCFSLIINTQQNRKAHVYWHQELGSDIHKFFMKVLRTVRFSTNYNFFAMMIERYIAFCVVRGATARACSTNLI